jgi:hypothetical protein
MVHFAPTRFQQEVAVDRAFHVFHSLGRVGAGLLQAMCAWPLQAWKSAPAPNSARDLRWPDAMCVLMVPGASLRCNHSLFSPRRLIRGT